MFSCDSAALRLSGRALPCMGIPGGSTIPAIHPRMKITFGLALDGFRPSLPVFNHLYCGPQGLVQALELRLGLATESTGGATRLHQYLRVLEKTSADKKCFFSDSLKVDRWGTGATLLSMRDELRMAGWDGADSPMPRLHDLSAVEKQTHECFAPGLPDRIEKICAEIATKSPAISEIQCVEPAEHLPFRLRCLLKKLGATFSCIPDHELASPATNLRLVQDCLCGRDISGKSWREGDDSVVFATAFSEITLAHAAVQMLRSEERPTLLATASCIPMADVLNISQNAAPALDSASPLRPVAQVLGLALEMRWEPPDPSILLQFLSHSVCPIDHGLRMALAESVADRPGIGSEKWSDAIEKYRERTGKEVSPEEVAEKLSRIESDLEDWISVERFPRKDGASGSALAETARRVEAWARKRASVSTDEAQSRHFASLASTAAEFSGIIKEITTVSPEELSHILEQVIGSGPAAGDRIAELGAPRCLADTGAAIEPTDSILWWGFEQQEPRLSKRWSLEELEYLEKVGVHLPTSENHLALARARAKRPFLTSRKQIFLLWPRSRGGDPVERHPLCTILEAKLGPLQIRDLDRDESLIKIDRSVRPLPLKKRWIRLSDPAALSSRREESYSSLSKFALRPFEWVFHYKAKLRRGSLKEINLLAQRGNLLHRVVERLLDPECKIKWISATNDEFNRWLEESIWPRLLETEGANFLMPGSQTGGQRLLEDARRAIWDLVGHMKKAHAVSAEADVHMEPIPFEGTMLGGIIDLKMTNRQGKTAVVDLKFGQAKPKRKELETNTALQLAAYGKLVSEKSGGVWPAVAYYILRSGSFLAQDQAFFPDAEPITCSGASPGPEAMWRDFLDVWRWRRKQLDSGWIEVPVEGTDETDGTTDCPSSVPPLAEWTSDPSAPRYDDFEFLTGWEATQ